MLANDPVLDGIAVGGLTALVGSALSYCLGRGLDFITLYNRPLNASDENEPLSTLPFTKFITPVGVLASFCLAAPYMADMQYTMDLHTLAGHNDFEAAVSQTAEYPNLYPEGISRNNPAPDSVLRQYSGNFGADISQRFTVPALLPKVRLQ